MQGIVFSTVLLGLLTGALANDELLFITTSSPSGATPACFTDASYGVYGNPPTYAYALSDDCDAHLTNTFDSGSVIPLPRDDEKRSLIWLQEAGVDDSIRGNQGDFMSEVENMLAVASDFKFAASNNEEELANYGQNIMGSSVGEESVSASTLGMQVLYRTEASALVSVKTAYLAQLDLILPRFVVPVAFPSSPRALIPVPPDVTKRVQAILWGLTFNPDVAAILNSLSLSNMRRDVRHLTGEDGQGILSRHSFSQGALVAANWIQGQIEATGAKCKQKPFLDGFAPNVIWCVSPICLYFGWVLTWGA